MKTKQTCPYCGRTMVKYPGKGSSVYMCPYIWCKQNETLTQDKRSWLQVYSGEEPMCLCKYFDQDFQMCRLDNSSVHYPKCTKNCDQYQAKKVTRFEKITKDPRTLAALLVSSSSLVYDPGWKSFFSDRRLFDTRSEAIQWTTEYLEQEEPVIWKKPEEPKKKRSRRRKKKRKGNTPKEAAVETKYGVFHVHDKVDCAGWEYDYCGEIMGFSGAQAKVCWKDDGISQMVDIDDLRPIAKEPPMKTQASMFSSYDIVTRKDTGKPGTVVSVDELNNEVLVHLASGEELWMGPDDIELYRTSNK